MYCEIPTFKRCCCCLPLRAGLLGYAYCRLALVLLCLMYYLFEIIETKVDFEIFGIIIIVPFVAFAIDISMTAAFIIGGHMKNPLPLKVYMWYIIVSTTLVVLLQTYLIFATTARAPWEWKYREAIISTSTPLIVFIHLYLIFLIRSQILKLESKQGVVYQIVDDKTNLIFEGIQHPKLQHI